MVLLSWYSSTKTSSNLSLNSKATCEGFIFPSSSLSINISKQRCSKSLKSKISFSLFLSLYLLENSIIKPLKHFINGYIFFMPKTASSKEVSKTLSLKFSIIFLLSSLRLLVFSKALSSSTLAFLTDFSLPKLAPISLL